MADGMPDLIGENNLQVMVLIDSLMQFSVQKHSSIFCLNDMENLIYTGRLEFFI